MQRAFKAQTRAWKIGRRVARGRLSRERAQRMIDDLTLEFTLSGYRGSMRRQLRNDLRKAKPEELAERWGSSLASFRELLEKNGQLLHSFYHDGLNAQ